MTEIPMCKTALDCGVREYKKHYRRGYRASEGAAGALDRADFRGEPQAWYDGYMDLATGRKKWHNMYCVDHVACGEH